MAISPSVFFQLLTPPF